MKERMTLLFVKHTRNILAAVTRTSAGDKPADDKAKELQNAQDLKDLVGDGLIVYLGGDAKTFPIPDLTQAEFLVPFDEFDAITDEFEEDVLSEARSFYCDEKKKAQLANPTLTLTPTSGDLKFAIPSALNVDTNVWALVRDESGSKSQIVSDKIEANKKDVTLTFSSPFPSSYFVLAMAAGYRPQSMKF